jgi:hypothetical protein
MFILGLVHEQGAGSFAGYLESLNRFDQTAAVGQRYAETEAKRMRLEGKSNRAAALFHRDGSAVETASGVPGGTCSLSNAFEAGGHEAGRTRGGRTRGGEDTRRGGQLIRLPSILRNAPWGACSRRGQRVHGLGPAARASLEEGTYEHS